MKGLNYITREALKHISEYDKELLGMWSFGSFCLADCCRMAILKGHSCLQPACEDYAAILFDVSILHQERIINLCNFSNRTMSAKNLCPVS